MDEAPSTGQCSVVYYCPGGDHDLSELYNNTSSLPDETSSPPSLSSIIANVRRLLDVDQGNFDQVFVSSQSDQCAQRLDAFAQTNNTVILTEVTRGDDDSKKTLPFLRSIAADIRSARHRHRVLPFALVAVKDLSLNQAHLESGTLDAMPSPLTAEAVSYLVGHVKDATRPPAKCLASDMAERVVKHISNKDKPRIAAHRPDKILSAQRRNAVEEAVGSWHFPAHDFNMDELTYGALLMLEHVLRNPDLEPYRLPRAELMTFLLSARREYKHEREVHYHNWRHAVDVTQSVYSFLCHVHLCPPSPETQSKGLKPNALESLLSPIEALILLVSAIGHDVGHPGVNNAFLVASNHSLALLYNDKSVLENYHCAAYSQLLRRQWPALGDISQFRSTMISTILATDMQRHFEYMGYLSDLKTKVEKSDEELADWNEKDKTQAKELVMALLLKAADISNVARPFAISAEWAKILMNEFARQGELESELQIPTCLFGGPPDKEDLLAAAQSQKGFMNLFGFPLFRGISEVLPSVSCTVAELENNKEVWDKRIVDEKAHREAMGVGKDSPRTYGSVTDSQVEEARARKRESEPAVVPTSALQSPSSPTKRQPAMESESPVRHPASEQRNRLQLGASLDEGKRSSNPNLPNFWPGVHATQLSPPSGASRRSSKDVALTHLQEYSAYAQQNIVPDGSRRGSADASWQIHQGYPGSRRGSKEESLTTILVTSQGSPASRGSPASSQTKVGKPGSPSNQSGVAKRQSLKNSQSHSGQASSTARYSVPSSRSPTTSSATTDQQSQSTTQPSSLAPTDDDSTQQATQHNIFPPAASAAVDPLAGQGGGWLDGLDGAQHITAPGALPRTPPDPSMVNPLKSYYSPSGDSVISDLDPQKSEPRLRESRSRSRMRGLKFWKKRKDVPGTASPTSGGPSF